MNEQLWARLGEEINAFQEEIRELPVTTPVAPDKVRVHLEKRFDLEAPMPLAEVVAETQQFLRRWSTHVTSPRYFGLFNPSVLEPGIVADVLAALYNPQLAAWSHAPAACEMERLVLQRFAEKLGLDPDDTAYSFTSGGAEANLQATLAALAQHFPETGAEGLFALPGRPALYLTAESHHSFVKIARMAGLGTASLREVACAENGTMDPAALREEIARDRAEGLLPFMVVATAGTTGAGQIDPLPEIAEVAEAEELWLHADAAWGGAAVLSERLRPLLEGIERADSITWDAHKWLSVPMGAGMFFCRHAGAVERAFAITTSYMPDETGGALDPHRTTAQWSRRATGLKVFMSLAALGMEGYAALIEHQTRMGTLLRDKLEAAGWLVVNDTPLPVVCFIHPEVRAGALSTAELLEKIYERGRVWISDVAYAGETVFRACITSYRTEKDDLDCLVEEVELAREQVAACAE